MCLWRIEGMQANGMGWAECSYSDREHDSDRMQITACGGAAQSEVAVAGFFVGWMMNANADCAQWSG